MRPIVVLLLLIGLVVLTTSDPVKSNNRDKAIESAKARKAKQDALEARKNKNNDEDIESKNLDDIEHEVSYEDEEEEKPAPKKKTSKKDKEKSQKKSDEKKVKQPKKKKDDDEVVEVKDVPVVLDNASIPNMTSFELFEIAREHRIDHLREIINEDQNPVDDIDKLKKIVDELSSDAEEEDDADSYEFQACNYETAGEDELCHCDMDEINCSAIVMDTEDPHLRTLDLVIQKKDFKPVYANFSSNAVGRLQRNKIIPGFEEFVSVLDLSHNHIRFADSDVFKPFTNLSKLYLSHNNLQTIKKPLFDAVKDTLHRLDLGYNRIKTLPDNVFEGLTNLKVLVLDGNPIQKWKKSHFKGLDNLEELSLDACRINDLPRDIFEFLPKLSVLSLRENQFEEIPAVVANLKSLKDVDMSGTNLTEIRDHAFAGDSDLEEIILENMPFLSVVRDCGFCGLPKLKTLLMNDNSKLVEIHPNAFGFVNSQPGHKAAAIEEFDIHNSNISTISEHMLNYDKISTFKISQNPWNCNCDIQFLMDAKFSFSQDSQTPKCGFPEELKDRHLVTLRASDACEDARFLGRSGRFSSVLGLALLVAFLVIGFFYLQSSGKLSKLIRQVRKEPEVTYTNLQAAGEDFALESDFQPRPAEV